MGALDQRLGDILGDTRDRNVEPRSEEIALFLAKIQIDLGIDEVLTFFVSMPILLFCWYYLVGWLIELWLDRRTRIKNIPLKLG